MSGHRIYYVPPRLVGSIADWSGKNRADGQSWLVEHAADMGFNAIWLGPLSETTRVEKIAHGKKLTGSNYAARNHFVMDEDVSSARKGVPLFTHEKEAVRKQDDAHLLHFCRQAEAKNIRVFGDLVMNHIAADHPLVVEENKAIEDIRHKHPQAIRGHKNKVIGLSYEEDGESKSLYFKFRRNNDLTLFVGGPVEDPWSDVAHINYSSPEARRFFVEGEGENKGYFKKVVDHLLECGIGGFRCDAAYMVPPETWSEIINYAKSKRSDAIFLAETLCTQVDKVERLSSAKMSNKNRPAFDLGMLGAYWWNFEDGWLPEGEAPRVRGVAKFGGAASPDNHDTDGTLAGNFRKMFNHRANCNDIIADICVRNYAVSTFIGNASYMQMGYEYCNEKQNRVFKGEISRGDWDALIRDRAGKNHTLDISDAIRRINCLKEDLQVENCYVSINEYGVRHDGKLNKIVCHYIDSDTGEKKADIVLLLNKKPEDGSIHVPANEIKHLEEKGLHRFMGARTGHDSLRDIAIFHSPLPPKRKPEVFFAPPPAATYTPSPNFGM